jgi:glycosyltransferase involved in cell wall biosynthesis
MKGLTTAKPKIAVITRTKNRTLLLGRALESVQSQTYRDFVQVVVNDGGDKEPVEELTKKYPASHLQVIHNPESVGLTTALNDDTWSEDRLELVVEFLDKTGSKGVVNIMDRVVEEIADDSVKEVSRNRWHEGVASINLYKQCLDNYLSNGCFTYRRDAYAELKGYDENLGVAEDWDFGIRFLLKYDVDFLATEHSLSFYHHRPEQKGDSGNSVFAGVDTHAYHLNMLSNKYLRKDIEEGRMGIGYIMNSLRYEREQREDDRNWMMDKVAVRLEGHMNYVGETIKKELAWSTRRIMDSEVFRKIAKRFNINGQQ